jgi:indolepyruvate ferredoxin oxidoreductase
VLPLTVLAINKAIERNGVAVAANQAAFAWGRAAVANPTEFAAAVGDDSGALQASLEAGEALVGRTSSLTGETRRLTAIRAGELVRFQNARLARRYIEAVTAAADAERKVTERTDFSAAVARGLFQLTAIKDEYETARLMAEPVFHARLSQDFPDGHHARFLLHPPILKALGRRNKIKIPVGWTPAFKILAAGKVLRGSRVDPFGHTRIRQLERDLRDHYWRLVADLTKDLSAASYPTAVEAAAAAELVRGYETVKERSVERYRERLRELDRLDAPQPGTLQFEKDGPPRRGAAR